MEIFWDSRIVHGVGMALVPWVSGWLHSCCRVGHVHAMGFHSLGQTAAPLDHSCQVLATACLLMVNIIINDHHHYHITNHHQQNHHLVRSHFGSSGPAGSWVLRPVMATPRRTCRDFSVVELCESLTPFAHLKCPDFQDWEFACYGKKAETGDRPGCRRAVRPDPALHPRALPFGVPFSRQAS